MFSEDNLHCYGTALPLLEFDQVPNKKACYVQDQIATDDEGRRRFHGAFTGGFSAGYWNTVGSKDGWTPTQFKSSRSEKAAERLQQCPEDFMDEEDKSIFGIAPKVFKINENYTVVEQEAKRKRKLQPIGRQEPLSGEPVLQQLLKPVKDKISMRILKAWGWRQGQGIGPRQTRKEKKKAEERNKLELYLMEKYGCDLVSSRNNNKIEKLDDTNLESTEDDSDTEDPDEMADITFAPEDYDMPPCSTKLDRFGLGYKSLRQHPVFHNTISENRNNEYIHKSQPLRLLDKKARPISFSGQAFGIGALEDDDDEDVFAKDDLTRYDFSLEDKNAKIGKKYSSQSVEQQELIFGEFLLNRISEKQSTNWIETEMEIPSNWKPRNWLIKRNRFEPLDPRKAKQLERKFEQMQQASNRKQRVEILGESSKPNEKPSLQDMQNMYKEREKKTKELLEKISLKSDNFRKGGIITEQQVEVVIKESETESQAATEADLELSNTFKPFSNDAPKQKRYDEFLKSKLLVEEDIEKFLDQIQPKEMSFWDKRTELKEFMQARKLYQPLKGIIADRFISETQIKHERVNDEKQRQNDDGESKQINFERQRKMWKPQALLCKRYNIPEPYEDNVKEDTLKPKATKKLSVFDYLETSVNKKEDFQTPQIITKLHEPLKPNNNEQKTQQLEWPIEKPGECKEMDMENPLIARDKQAPDKLNKKGFVAKTVLEKQVVESLNKPPTQKKELFKAIFLDDDDDNDNEDDATSTRDNNDKHNNNTTTTTTTSAAAAPTMTTKTAAAMNLLRNNSPPRGIFKALFSFDNSNSNTGKLAKSNINVDDNLKSNEKVIEDKITFQPKINKDIYGPALPTKLLNSEHSQITSNQNISSSSTSSVNQISYYKQNHHRENEIWIEKTKFNEFVANKTKGEDDEDDDSNTSNTSSSDDNDEHVKHKKHKLKKKTKIMKKSHKHAKKKHNKKKKKKKEK